MDRHYTITHSGIKGQKWGIRRFRNYDDTLTEAGKIRYGDGGSKMIKKAEKERNRRNKILSDPKKLYKHRDEFTKAEIEKAMEKADASEKLRMQIAENKIREQESKLALKKMKSDWKTEQSEKKLAEARAKQDFQAKKARDKQLYEAKKAEEQRKKEESKRKIEKEDKTINLETSSKNWKNRAEKYKSMWETSGSVKSILDAMGVTDPKDGASLFTTLGKSLGFDAKPVSELKSEKKKKKKNDEDD